LSGKTRPAAGKAVEVRFPTEEGAAILSELAKPSVRHCERVVLSLVGLSSTHERDAVLVSAVRPVPDDCYYMSESGSSWDPKFTAKVAEEASVRRLGVLMIHGHSSYDHPGLSLTDRNSLEKVLEAFKALIPTRPHGSVVIGGNKSVGGVVWLPSDGLCEVRRAKWLGSPVEVLPPLGQGAASHEMYSSQASLIGNRGQHLLSQTVIGIVGLGGGGSHVAQQAAMAGFGHLVLVDPDVVEDRNRARMVGSRENDISKLKAKVISRMVKGVSRKLRVTLVTEKFPAQKAVDALKQCDLMISCVDSFHSRDQLNAFAWRHLIPLIDIGIGTRVSESGGRIGLNRLAGHVHVYIPGNPCMRCTGLVSDEKVYAETGGRPEYVKGSGGPGQVVSFNGVVASLALTEAIQLATGALLEKGRPQFLEYDGMTPRILQRQCSRSPSCMVCRTDLGAGDPVWAGGR
jgi:molybdopterin/thiamine biosynthesis adenylyltransferase